MIESQLIINISYNPIFDSLALFNLWQSDQLTNAGFVDLDELLTDRLDTSTYPILSDLVRYDINAIQLCEFLVQGYPSDNVTEFCSALRKLPLESYLYQVFDFEYSKREIQHLLSGASVTEPQETYTLINPYRLGKDLELLQEPLLAIIEQVAELIQPFSKQYQPGLLPYKKFLHDQLSQLSPLDVAQNELAKRFIRLSEYQEYHFIVSPFATRAMRFFNDDKLLTFTGPNIEKSIRNEADAVKLLKILADDTRMSILKILAKEKLYGKQIAERLGKTSATISHHLETLHKAGLIRQEKQQQTKYYSFHSKALDSRFRDIVDLIVK
jgi:DNA-binding transcriptional ArsR family regulator